METLPKRKNIRLSSYDYNLPGMYFITICTAEKKALFSRVVGALHEAPAQIELTAYGKIVKQTIEFLPERFNLDIENYVIMPDHVHILLELSDYERALREAPLQGRSLLAQCVGYLKADVSKKIHSTSPNVQVWQRGFMEHIIRNEVDYTKHYDYIENNPALWLLGRDEI